MKFFFKVLVFSFPPPSYLTKLGRPNPRVAQKKLVTHPPTKTSNADVDRYIREPWLTVNDLINARGVYLIFGVQKGAFNRWEALKERGVCSRNLF